MRSKRGGGGCRANSAHIQQTRHIYDNLTHILVLAFGRKPLATYQIVPSSLGCGGAHNLNDLEILQGLAELLVAGVETLDFRRARPRRHAVLLGKLLYFQKRGLYVWIHF